jgi:acyl-CoA synthetase (AMP-forming)/AMP-acid ligase II
VHSFLSLTLGDVIRKNAHWYPDVDAFVYEDQHLTHRQYLQRCLKLGSAWFKLGARRQDRISILAQNRMEFVEVYGAGELSGYITATVNWRLAAPEIQYILNDSTPRILVFEDIYAETIAEMRSQLKSIETFVCIGKKPAGMDWALSYEDVLATGDEGGAPIVAQEDDIAYIIYTSGTTGRPKGCMLGQRESRSCAQSLAPAQKATPYDRCLLMMPFFHIGAKAIQNAQHSAGGTVYIQRGFDAEAILRCISEERITSTHMAPVMVQMLLDSPALANADLRSLHTICYAAAPMPSTVLRKAMELIGGNVFMQSYGQTEGVGTALLHDEHRPDGSEHEKRWLQSVGRPYQNVLMRIVDDNDNECPVGEPGEITFKTVAMFRGYWNNTAATLETLRGGWLHTGDVGKIDEQGFLYLVDRKKDMIISGGENIYSREVEEAVIQHDAVSECAVIGIADEKWGEAVCAIVLLKPGRKATADELIKHTVTQIASYKKPKKIIFVDDIPKLPSGKVNKVELRKLYGAG